MPAIGYLTAGSAPTGSDPYRGIPSGTAGVWLRGGQEHCDRISQCSGQTRSRPPHAAELVRLKMDIIVTAGPPPTRAAKEATTTIPIVMTQDPDPVGNGFVASLARPGGNITGLSEPPELSGKQLELLKETVPKLSRVAVFGTSTQPGQRSIVKRNGARGWCVGSEASIRRHTGAKGCRGCIRSGRHRSALTRSS